ncbi:hypothetical protein [Abiotrophia defectiva]|uniref:hypothetical protein n=1 Tax=Abiotrophia defectiva TaxID=46125 RepID=UPI0028D682CB|nr:hypothetical protein [Abiotrophia defectiva]
MYFKKFEVIRDKSLIKELDEWLACLSEFYYDKINPMLFIIGKSLDSEAALSAFEEAVTVGILKRKIILINNDRIPLETYYTYDSLPPSYIDEYDNVFKVEDDNVELWYELLEKPERKSLRQSSKRNNEILNPSIANFKSKGCSNIFAIINRIAK